jgi:uncharacterized membrane protein (UPF0127 family)
MNTKTKIIVLIALPILLIAGIYILNYRPFYFPIKSVEIQDHKFAVDLAVTPTEREKGLGGREQLCSDCGMLFIFPQKGVYDFWMKDMRFNLDIIWISDGKIVYIAKDNSFQNLNLINPGMEANLVLEVNANLSDEYGWKIGDKVEMK